MCAPKMSERITWLYVISLLFSRMKETALVMRGVSGIVTPARTWVGGLDGDMANIWYLLDSDV